MIVSGMTRVYWRSVSAVASVLPSSRTTTSYSRGCSSNSLRSRQSTSPIVGPSSKAGMQMVIMRLPGDTVSGASRSDVPECRHRKMAGARAEGKRVPLALTTTTGAVCRLPARRGRVRVRAPRGSAATSCSRSAGGPSSRAALRPVGARLCGLDAAGHAAVERGHARAGPTRAQCDHHLRHRARSARVQRRLHARSQRRDRRRGARGALPRGARGGGRSRAGGGQRHLPPTRPARARIPRMPGRA